jgi:DNA-directed RNA polymerase subunit RPC12/RpoP
MRPANLVVKVRCLHCGHKSVLSDEALTTFGIKPDAPIAGFVKRLRCSRCGSGSIMANRVASNEAATRRLRA